MEEFGLLLIVVVLIVVIALNSSMRKYISMSNMKMSLLQSSIDQLKREVKRLTELKQSDKMAVSTELAEPVSSPPVAETIEEPNKEDIQESVSEEIIADPIADAFKAQGTAVSELVDNTEADSQEEAVVVDKPLVVHEPETSAGKTFFQRYPDVEKFIGENLINKIGIVILILGIGFLVKFAIDNNWINEIGRVAIGVLSAGALIGVAHRMRKDFVSFSSVLIGGGLALLYFTVSYAFYTEGYPLYQRQALSFALLIAITSFAVFLSIAYNRIEIAMLAILGGFTSPMMISSGTGNYVVLFTYITLLDIGMLVLAYYKKWRLVNLVSFVFTVLLFGSWITMELFNDRYDAFSGAIYYATVFYVIFFLMNIIYNLKQKMSFKVADISLLLSNTFIYFSFMMIMLSYVGEGAYKGFFAILMSVFNFGFAYYIHSKHKTDTNLLYLLIGLVFTFVTLAIPLQLKGNYITLFWSVESVLLLWLGQKSGFKIMKQGSTAVLVLMLISLVMDWSANYQLFNFITYGDHTLAFLFNKMVITTLIAGASLVSTLFLLKNEQTPWLICLKLYRMYVLSMILLVFYFGGLFEVIYQAQQFFVSPASRTISVFTFNSLFMLCLLIGARRFKNKLFSKVIAVIVVLFMFMLLHALSNVFVHFRDVYFSGKEPLGNLVLSFRWVCIFSAYVIAFMLYKLLFKINEGKKDKRYKQNVSFFVFTLIYLLSADLDTLAVLISQSDDVLMYTQKTGYAILWGLISFVLLLIGLRRKEQILRILGLSLFAITIAKLFIYDISNISEGGKILAFILLGVLLLVVSFMYQKLKKIVIDERKEEKTVEHVNRPE
jgi:uncharacterized membrane protein